MKFLRVLVISVLSTAAAAYGFSVPPPAPALGAPTGTVVNVSSDAQLQAAVRNLQSNSTIMIAKGTYQLSSFLNLNGVNHVAIRGATGNRDDVVLLGSGMTNNGAVTYGIMVSNAQDVLIADLTIGEVFYHPIALQGPSGCQRAHIYNCRLFNAGEQFVKSNPNSNGTGVNDSSVEYCLIEYLTTAPTDYTNGVDVHTGNNWIIRNNLFRNIRSPQGQPLAGPAILMWNHSTNPICEKNTFLNCERAIAYGLGELSSGTDCSGGIIRNNFIHRGANETGDVGIYVCDCPNTQVLNNTIIQSGTYPNAIEYRFAETTGTIISNNLCDGAISARDGATATLKTNITNATAALFVNAAAGDLHLLSTATAAIDKGTATANCTDDWDGNARPSASAYDIGADEFGATGGNTNKAPAITSDPSAAPNPATVGQAVTFTVAASDPNGDALTYAWTFGDGTNGSGSTATHSYSTAGTFTATAKVSDPAGLQASASVTVTVTATNSGGGGGGGSGGGGGGNGGGNGGGGTGPGKKPMTLTRLQGAVSFKTSARDGCIVNGMLPDVPAGFAPNGQALTLNVNGATLSVTLDSHGRGKADTGSIALKLKLTRDKTTKQTSFAGGNVPFTAKLLHGSWATAWGMGATTPAGSLPLTVSISIGGSDYAADATVNYFGKPGTGGKFSVPR